MHFGRPSSSPTSRRRVPSPAYWTTTGASAMSFFRIGLRVPLSRPRPVGGRHTPHRRGRRSSAPFELQPDSVALRVRCRSSSAVRPTKSSSVFQIDGEADPGLERVDLVVDLVSGEDQAATRCAGCRALRARAASGRAPRRPTRSRPRSPARHDGMAPDLVAELPCSPTRDHDWNPVARPDPR